MSDAPEDLDLSQLGQQGGASAVMPPQAAPQTAAAPPSPVAAMAPQAPPAPVAPAVQAVASTPSVAPTVTSTPDIGIAAAPAAVAPGTSQPNVMQSPEVPYPVAAPVNPGDPVPTINHYPWTPLPLEPLDPAAQPPAAAPPVAAPVVVEDTIADLELSAPAAVSVQPEPVASDPAPPLEIAAPPVAAETSVSAAPLAPAVPPAYPPGQNGPSTPPELPHSKIDHIYSDYTREVWRVFRPSRGFGLFVMVSISAVVVIGLFLFQNSALSIFEIPFVKELLQLE